MRVFRFENDQHNGPYATTAETAYAQHGEMRNCEDHPTPDEDGICDGYTERKRYHYGFQTLEQLKAWFASPMGRSAMDTVGCKLYEFEVPRKHVSFGHKHLGFKREYARRVRRLDPVTLEPLKGRKTGEVQCSEIIHGSSPSHSQKPADTLDVGELVSNLQKVGFMPMLWDLALEDGKAAPTSGLSTSS